MDTRFWGPPGWKLLHTICTAYDASPQSKRLMGQFLETLPYILPCKFCRASLTEYYQADPWSAALGSSELLQRWMWRIHNRVNAKLRGQGMTIPCSPRFERVAADYKARVAELIQPKSCSLFPAWDFLFSIAYNHPKSTKSTPMLGAPPRNTVRSEADLNRWNMLDTGRRMKWYIRFWKALPAVLPEPWRTSWLSALRSAGGSRPQPYSTKVTATAWLWRLRCAFDEGGRDDPFKQVCGRLAAHSSGCSTSQRARTCRARSARRQRAGSRRQRNTTRKAE
jgi:hypothetical protein